MRPPQTSHSLTLGTITFLALVFGGRLTTVSAQLLPLADSQLSPQVYVDEVENQTRAQLERAKQLLADKRWDEAIDVVTQVLERDGEKLFSWPPPPGRSTRFHRFVPIREYCHHWIGALASEAPDALQIYRNRVDPLAERWFQQGLDQRDEAVWQRVVDQMFVSSVTDDILLRLGESALERGDYTGARAAWQRMSPLLRSPIAGLPLWPTLRAIHWDEDWKELEPKLRASHAGRTLEYPDTDINVGSVLARLALTSILEGSLERARLENELLRRLFPDATGQIGGRQGVLFELIENLIEQSKQWPAPQHSTDWQTFAGNSVRNQIAAPMKGVAEQPLWSIAFSKISAQQDRLPSGAARVAEDAAAALSYFPIALGSNVFISSGDRIRAVKLQDGQPVWSGAAESETPETIGTIYAATGSESWRRLTRHTGVPRFTLTSNGQSVFAKVASPVTAQDVGETVLSDERGYLVGLDLRAQGRVSFTAALADLGLTNDWAFEGSPVIAEDGVYVSLRRRDTVRDQCHVVCLDPRTGKPRWRRFVCAAEWPRRTLPCITHNLLTLRHDTLYVQSNLGAIAALNARTGTIRWLTSYPRSEYQTGHPDHSDRHFLRDPSPCLLHHDVLVAAPSDSEFLFALDATTGQLLWTTDGDRARDVVHLLGVGKDQLIVSGDYLYWFDIYNGQPVAQFPPPRKEATGLALPSPRGYGRGTLAGDEVWWPTRDKILIFPQQASRKTSRPTKTIDLAARKTTGGHLLITNNTLLISSADKLTAFKENDNSNGLK